MQHFLLSPAAKTLSLAQVFRMSDEEAETMFRKVRWIETDRDALADYNVIGLAISRDCDLKPFLLGWSGTSGSGTLHQIGFPDALANCMTHAMLSWFDTRIDEVKQELIKFGIEV